MLKNFFAVTNQVSVLFLLAGVGFILGKKGWLDGKCASQLSQLLICVVAPCAIINALQVAYSEKIISDLLFGYLFLIFQYIALILVSHFSFQQEPPQRRSVLQFAQVYAKQYLYGYSIATSRSGNRGNYFCRAITRDFSNVPMDPWHSDSGEGASHASRQFSIPELSV